jgi:hypothetical protein
MRTLESKSVLGQAVQIFCCLVALAVLAPLSARGGLEPDRPDPVLAGKTTSASIKVDTASGLWYELVDVPVLIRNDVQIGQFRLEVDFRPQYLAFVGAEMGEALSEIDWEYFTYRLEPSADTLYRVLLFGIYDVPDPHQGVPLAPNSEYVELGVIYFVIGFGDYPSDFFPIWFEWEASDCLENTLQDSTFDTLYVSQDSLQFNYIDCPPESLDFASISSSVEFLGGGVYAFYPPPFRGDINANWVPYEVADFVLFSHYLQYGDSMLTVDPEMQSSNSDVNWDDWRWSMADFIHLVRVIMHDAPEVIEPTSQSQHNLDTWISFMRAMPNDTIALPLWYYGWGTEAVHGISFKVDYDPDSLTLIGVDFSGTPLEDWEINSIREEDGWVRLNACPEAATTSLSDSLPSGENLQVARLVFEISDVDTPTFISVSFGDDTSSSVQANAFATIDGDLTRLGVSNAIDGGIQVGGAIECKRGDINYNLVTYEVADLMLFYDFLLYGPEVLIFDPEVQTCASDMNADGLYWTIADLLYMIRVILHDAVEIPAKGQEINFPWHSGDELRLISSSGHPGEVVSVPVWLSNSTNAWGATFKVIFDSSSLSVEGVDVAQTRIEEWQEVNPVVNPGELFFFAFYDWVIFGPPWSYLSIEPGEGTLIKVGFRVDESAPPGTSLPITFETNEDWGHYNSYTDTSGTVFVQPSTVSGWIFTDVISGDANSDGIVDAADLVYLINYLYRGQWPPSPESLGDFNQDGQVDSADVVALINYLFGG